MPDERFARISSGSLPAMTFTPRSKSRYPCSPSNTYRSASTFGVATVNANGGGAAAASATPMPTAAAASAVTTAPASMIRVLLGILVLPQVRDAQVIRKGVKGA